MSYARYGLEVISYDAAREESRDGRDGETRGELLRRERDVALEHKIRSDSKRSRVALSRTTVG